MKRRKRKLRRTKPRILIICEGETERNYFQAMKEDDDYKQPLSAINPQVVAAKNSTPDGVLLEARKKEVRAQQEGNPYNQVWLVFDHDHHPQRLKVYQEAQKAKYQIAFSAICFEQWYLLHFKKSAKAYLNADSLLKELKKYYANYEKAKQNDFANLKEHLKMALVHTDWLRKQSEEENVHLTSRNPYTDVDVLVKLLMGYAK